MNTPRLERVGKFEITELIGEGAMGVVYRARDPMLNRYVALKLMSASLARGQELRDRFLREAQAAGSLQHPNIVTIYDLGEYDGHLYIAMEYIEGADLAEIMAAGDELPLVTKLDIIIDVLGGLHYAHKGGVVHRDVKPANIRVTVDGRAKIMDFGIAHLQESNLTSSGALVGTPDYMAPEQITSAPLGPPTDVFAVGTVLYELLAAKRPFPADTLHAVLMKVVTDEPVPLGEVAPNVPREVQAVVEKAMRKKPEDRYQSAEAMARALSAAKLHLSGVQEARTVIRTTPLQTLIPQTVVDQARRTQHVWMGVGVSAVLLAAGSLFLLRGNTTPAPVPVDAPAAVAVDSVVPPATPVVTAPAPAARRTPNVATTPPPATSVESVGRATAVVAPSEPIVLAAVDTALPEPTESLTPPPDPTTRAGPVGVTQPIPVPPVAPSAPAPGPIGDPEAVQQVLTAYERALETEDPAALRGVFPRIGAQQLRGWEAFFDAVDELQVALELSGLEVQGDQATAAAVGTYVYRDAQGDRQTQPVRFSLTFQRVESGWVIAAVR